MGLVNNCDSCEPECAFIDVIQFNDRVRYYAGQTSFVWHGSALNNAGQHVNGGTGGCAGLHFYHIDFEEDTIQKYTRNAETGVDGGAVWDEPAPLSGDSATASSFEPPPFDDWSTAGYPATFMTVNGMFAMWGIASGSGVSNGIHLQVRDADDEANGAIITEGFLWDFDNEEYLDKEAFIILYAIPATETRVAVSVYDLLNSTTDQPYSTDVIFADGKWILRRFDHSWSKVPSVGFAVKDGLWMGSMTGIAMGPLGPENYLWNADSLLVRTAGIVVDNTANYPLGDLIRTWPSARCGKIYTCDMDGTGQAAITRYNIGTEELEYFYLGNTLTGYNGRGPYYVVKDTFPGGDEGVTEGELSDECNDCGDQDADPGTPSACEDCEGYVAEEECIQGSFDATTPGALNYTYCPNWFASEEDPTTCGPGMGPTYCVGVSGIFHLQCCCGDDSIASVDVVFENRGDGMFMQSYHVDFDNDNDPESYEATCFGYECCYVLNRGYRLCFGGEIVGNVAVIAVVVTVTTSNGCTLTLEEEMSFFVATP